MESDQEICNESEKYKLYLQRLLWNPRGCHMLLSGSFFELPFCYVISNPTDVDRMIINPNIIAIPRYAAFARNFGQEILIIDTRDTQTGFVRLLKEHSNNVSYFNIDRSNLHGPAETLTLAGLDIIEPEAIKIELSREGFDKMSQDEVVAISCPFWPTEAHDWITRTTLSGWPEKGLKDHIVLGGCHFVTKSHHTEPDDSTQWRYSFSQAEVVLINSWNDIQKYVYHILRIIKGRITKTCRTDEKSVFNTYMIKTLMLWACELNPEKFWAEENVEASVEELLCQTIECLIDRECPHYFITGLNILDCSVGTDITSEIVLLEQFMCEGVSRIMADFPKFNVEMNLHVAVSKKILKFLCSLPDTCVNPLDPTFGRYNFSDAWIYSEHGNLFKGIMVHKQLQSLNSQMRSRVNTTNSSAIIIEHFRRCLEEDSDNHSTWMVNLQDSLHVIIGSIAKRCISKGLSGPGIYTCSTDGPMSRDKISPKLLDRVCCYERVSSNLHASCQSTRSQFAVQKMNFIGELIIQECSKFCGNPSEVISGLFCANFCYTYLHNYRVASDICRKTLQMLESDYTLPLMCQMYKRVNFPILFLSSDWMSLYDENIQTVFGFVGLFICVGYEKEVNRGNLIKIPSQFIENLSTGKGQKHPKKASRHSKVISSLVVQLCPAAFINYIGMQCQKQLSLSYDSLFDMYRGPQKDARLRLHALLLLQCAYSIA